MVRKIEAEDIEREGAERVLGGVDGILVPGGFGYRGIPGKIEAIRFARERGIPFFGICLGLQCAVIEFARNVVGLDDANTTEIDRNCRHPVVCLLDEQYNITDMGGTMRLGQYPCALAEGSRAHAAYGSHADPRAAPAPLRVQQPVPPAVRGARHGVHAAPARTASWSRWSSCRTIRGSWRCSATRSSSRSRRRS